MKCVTESLVSPEASIWTGTGHYSSMKISRTWKKMSHSSLSSDQSWIWMIRNFNKGKECLHPMDQPIPKKLSSSPWRMPSYDVGLWVCECVGVCVSTCICVPWFRYRSLHKRSSVTFRYGCSHRLSLCTVPSYDAGLWVCECVSVCVHTCIHLPCQNH